MNIDWLQTAKLLACGTKIKVLCCGNSPSMLVSHSERGYSCHCFRCEDPESHKFIPHGERSISEIQKHRNELNANRGKEPYLPADFTLDIPVQHAYFLKYGISLDTASDYNIGYSEYFHRIIIPVYRKMALGNVLEAVHMRAIHPGDKPKYLNLGKPCPDALFWGKPGFGADLIIVEDVLSAIKLSLRGHNAVALNGSDITSVQANRLCETMWLRHFVWLDGDKAGRKGSKKAVKQLKLMGARDVWEVCSPEDPKTYHAARIDWFLDNAERQW